MSNQYEARIAAKKARLEAAASRASAESQAVYTRVKSQASAIPFGQPILVGHHSERRDRAFRSRLEAGFGKSFDLQKKAEHLAQKAASVGTGGISSDDPTALVQLREKLEKLQKMQEHMKKVNALLRKNDDAGLLEMGLSQAQIDNLKTPDFCNRKGFPDYKLTNNNATIRATKKRIEQLEAQRSRASVEVTKETYRYQEDTEENRVMFFFDGKPEKRIREKLASYSFKWSPSREGQPWVRKITGNALYAAQCVKKFLDDIAAEAGQQ